MVPESNAAPAASQQPTSSGPAQRQSCDRCHKQKLRCTRNKNNNSGVCDRCMSKRAQCVYSLSLPKGRPSLHRLAVEETNSGNKNPTNDSPKGSGTSTPISRGRPSSTSLPLQPVQPVQSVRPHSICKYILWHFMNSLLIYNSQLPSTWPTIQNPCLPHLSLARWILRWTRPHFHGRG